MAEGDEKSSTGYRHAPLPPVVIYFESPLIANSLDSQSSRHRDQKRQQNQNPVKMKSCQRTEMREDMIGEKVIVADETQDQRQRDQRPQQTPLAKSGKHQPDAADADQERIKIENQPRQILHVLNI